MITVCNIQKRYNPNNGLQNVSLTLSRSEVLALLGPSGCGKTTLLRIIAGFERPDEGKVLIDEAEASTPAYIMEPNKRGISMIFQDLALWPHMTVQEHIEFAIHKDRLSKQGIKSKIAQVLNNVSLKDCNQRYPHQLSGGEKQRLAIARAIASQTRYLLMDEPFSNLDVFLKEELQKLVIRLKESLSMGIIYVTHNIDEVFTVSDRIIVMNNGQLLQIDRMDQMVNSRDSLLEILMKLDRTGNLMKDT